MNYCTLFICCIMSIHCSLTSQILAAQSATPSDLAKGEILKSLNISPEQAKAPGISQTQGLKGALLAEQILGKLERMEQQIRSIDAKLDKLIATESHSMPQVKTASLTLGKEGVNKRLKEIKEFTEAEGIKPSKEMLHKLVDDKIKKS
jgi:hypothetical protein